MEDGGEPSSDGAADSPSSPRPRRRRLRCASSQACGDGNCRATACLFAVAALLSLAALPLGLFGGSRPLAPQLPQPEDLPPDFDAARAPASTPGGRLLEYLHSRGAALHITAPRAVRAIYLDARDVDWADPTAAVTRAAAAGFNVIVLAFHVAPGGATDALGAWVAGGAAFDAAHNASIAAAHARGAVVMLSAGGATDSEYHRADAAAYGAALAAAALAAQLDGVDFDLENIGTGCMLPDKDAAATIEWLVTATLAARAVLGPLPLISHAPLAAYFGPVDPPPEQGMVTGSSYAGGSGCYAAVWRHARGSRAGASVAELTPEIDFFTGLPVDAAAFYERVRDGPPAIDWFSVQFYNSFAGCYESYDTLFINSHAGDAWQRCFPNTAIRQIADAGVPLARIVLGKPLLAGDADGNHVPAAALAAMIARARDELGWHEPGVMAWQWSAEHAPAWLAALALDTASDAAAPAAATPEVAPGAAAAA